MSRYLEFAKSMIDEMLSFPVFVFSFLFSTDCHFDEDTNTPLQNTLYWVGGVSIILFGLFIILLGLFCVFLLIYVLFKYCVIPSMAIVAVISLVYVLFCNKDSNGGGK